MWINRRVYSPSQKHKEEREFHFRFDDVREDYALMKRSNGTRGTNL
jgi:hypothetical protein